MDLKNLADNLQTSMADIKSTVEQQQKDNDVLVEEKFQKQSDDFTLKFQQIQDHNAKIEAQIKTEEEKRAKLEAVLSRPDGESSEVKEAKLIADSEQKFKQFLRGEVSFGQKSEVTLYGKEFLEGKSMSTDVNPDGGELVRPEFVDNVVTRVFETSPIRQVANVMTTGSKSISMLIDDDEDSASWTGEGSASSNTDTAELGRLDIIAHKLDAEPRATTELLEDAYLDLESWLSNKVANKFSRTENTAFVTGDGVGKPRGFMSYDAWASAGAYEQGKIEQVNSGSSGAVTSDGAIDLQNSLVEKYQPNAVWMMKRATYGSFLKLTDTNNQFLFGMDFLKNGQLQPTLLGKRVVFADDVAAASANSLSAVYGDFSAGYTIVDRIGLSVLRDPYSNKGFITFYTTKRVGGDVTAYDALKILKLAA